MEVTLKPLRRSEWAGVHKYKNCNDWIGSYWTRSGIRYTGLTDEEADRLGAKIKQDLYPASEFWHTFYIRISNKDVYLNTDDPYDEIKYIFLKNHKRVANGYSDNKPGANYILINKEAEAVEANKYNQTRRKAITEFGKLSAVEQRKVLRLYGHRSDNLSAELVENKLFDLVEKDPQKFLDKWSNNKNRETEYLIQEAMGKNVIRRNKSEYKYGTDTIGYTLEDAIDYINNPEHRDLKEVIINETKVKA